MRKLILVAFLFISLFTNAQITYFGSASSPADNGTNATSPLSVTPPASMIDGDLVCVYVSARNATATFTVGTTGGQTWTTQSSVQSVGGILSGAFYWCRFNGTWAADPAWTFSSTTNTSVVMHVFRPTASSNTWAIETGLSGVNTLTSFNASSPVSPFGNVNTVNNSMVFLAIWNTDDDNTWGSLTGSGWVVTGNAQYRNLAGSDESSSYAHKIITVAGNVATPSKAEATLGNDGGITGAFAFYEITSTPHSRRINWIMKP